MAADLRPIGSISDAGRSHVGADRMAHSGQSSRARAGRGILARPVNFERPFCGTVVVGELWSAKWCAPFLVAFLVGSPVFHSANFHLIAKLMGQNTRIQHNVTDEVNRSSSRLICNNYIPDCRTSSPHEVIQERD